MQLLKFFHCTHEKKSQISFYIIEKSIVFLNVLWPTMNLDREHTFYFYNNSEIDINPINFDLKGNRKEVNLSHKAF